ncbi:unnamed protein product [Schistosoma mattheei]|uniref:Uncharacterized protein n=1 Tax=Schistosoma mattheei TaxID=31246 RepID=A0A183P3I7_9TREM|nr:unnamed protein product [Schistosoma mattheei]
MFTYPLILPMSQVIHNNNNLMSRRCGIQLLIATCIKYETILSHMQGQLTCIIEERDMLANQLNELTGTNKSLLPNSTIQTSTIVTESVSSSVPVSTPTVSTISEIVGLKSCSISHPIMGLNRSVQMKSNNNDNSNLSYPPTSSRPTPSTTGFSVSKQQTNVDNNIVNQLHKAISRQYTSYAHMSIRDWSIAILNINGKIQVNNTK